MSILFTYDAKSANDLIGQCQELARVGMSGGWSFRGQADSAWRLVPSLLRSVPVGFSPQNFEAALVHDLRILLRDRSVLPSHIIERDDFVLAFAQHYRVPTRLTDWTRDPLVALYFAASDALREVHIKGRRNGKLSVFAMGDIYLAVGSASSRGELIHPPRAGNPNLAAQRAHLVKHSWEVPDLLAGTEERKTDAPARNVSPLIDSRFMRLDLDWLYAHEVLEQLRASGLTGDYVYPGEDGLARFAQDLFLEGQSTVVFRRDDDIDPEDGQAGP